MLCYMNLNDHSKFYQADISRSSNHEGRAFPLHFGLRGLEVMVDMFQVDLQSHRLLFGKEKRGKMKMDVLGWIHGS